MSADWKAGDKALCVYNGGGKNPVRLAPNGDPQKGTTYLVEWVSSDVNGNVGLSLFGCPYLGGLNGEEIGWDHKCFRKVVPACDRVSTAIEERA